MGRHSETRKTPDLRGAYHFPIRAMSEKDLGDFCLLFQRIFSQPPWNENWTLETIGDLAWRIMQRDGFIGTVAEYDSTSVGYAIGYRLLTLSLAPRLFYLDHLFVDEKFRGIGIGSGLISKIAHLAIIRRMGIILLMTRKSSSAEALYLDEGFRRLLPFIHVQKKIVLYKRLQ